MRLEFPAPIAWLPLVFAVLLVAAPADAAEFQLEYHASGQHAYDPSFDAFGSGDTPNVFISHTVGIGYALDELVGFDGLLAYGAFSSSGAEQTRFDDDFTFGWRRTLFLAGAEYGYDVSPVFRPFARVTAGLARQRVRIDAPGGSPLSEARLDFVTRNSAGLEFRTPYGDPDSDVQSPFGLPISLGLTLEAGYTWQQNAQFDGLGASEGDASDTQWSRSGADLGTLDTDGWFWAIGTMVRLRL